MNIQWLRLGADGGGAILVRVTHDNGLAGLAEIAGNGDWQPSTEVQIRTLLGACSARLQEVDPQSLNAAIDAISAVTATDAELGPAIRSGLDVALHDLAGHQRGCATAEVLGGRYRSEIEVSRRLDPSDLQDPAPASALRLIYRPEPRREAASFKAGSSLEVLKAAIRQAGDHVQVDVSPAVPFDNPALARTFAEALLLAGPRIGLGLLQPLAETDLLGHATLCASLPIPVVLDTAVRSAGSMAQIVRLAAADRVVLDIDRVGGLREACRIVALAEPAAIGISAASAGRTAIGAIAALHLSAVLHDNFPVVLDRLDAAALPGVALPVSGNQGFVSPSPGLGIRLPDELASRFEAVR